MVLAVFWLEKDAALEPMEFPLYSLIAVFWSCCLSLKQKQAVQLNVVSWLLFSLLQGLAALICQFCFSLPPSSWHDWPRLLRPPGNPPACPPQGVCSVIYSASSKRLPCLHFLSSFPPLIKMQKAEQRLVWKAQCWGGCWCVQWGVGGGAVSMRTLMT